MKSGPRLLWLLCRVHVFEPVAAAFDGDDFGVVHDPAVYVWCSSSEAPSIS
jgi:hypothetical protein